MPIFQQSVDAELYEWLLKEQKRRRARNIQDVIRQILREATAEDVKHGTFYSWTEEYQLIRP